MASTCSAVRASERAKRHQNHRTPVADHLRHASQTGFEQLDRLRNAHRAGKFAKALLPLSGRRTNTEPAHAVRRAPIREAKNVKQDHAAHP